MISLRAAAFPAFSNANPKYSVRKAASEGVIDVIAPSTNPTSSERFQSRTFTPLPISVGSPMVQLPMSPSKSVLTPASVVGAVMSSTHTPSPWTAQSLAYEIETVTSCPA